jgi:hypothetical protein
MTEPGLNGPDCDEVAILFPPDTVPVIDIFRAMGDFEDRYDLAALDALEHRLAALMDRDMAKGLVSDALLLAFGLRRERQRALRLNPLQSRRGSCDEYRLIALLAAVYWNDFVLAAEAAAALGILHSQSLIALAFDITRRLEEAGVRLEAPDARLLRRSGPSLRVEASAPRGSVGPKLSRDH